jgi:hypothetical protein
VHRTGTVAIRNRQKVRCDGQFLPECGFNFSAASERLQLAHESQRTDSRDSGSTCGNRELMCNQNGRAIMRAASILLGAYRAEDV